MIEYVINLYNGYRLLYVVDEGKGALQCKLAVDLELEGDFLIDFLVSRCGVGGATVVELGCFRIEGEIDTQRRADDGHFGNNVAFSAVGVALLADTALDFGRALRGCGESVFEDCVAFLDDFVGKCVFLCKCEALSCRFLCHNFVVIELFTERRVKRGYVLFLLFFYHCGLWLFHNFGFVHLFVCGRAGKSDALVAKRAIIVTAAHIAVIVDAVVPFLLVQFGLQCNFIHSVLP